LQPISTDYRWHLNTLLDAVFINAVGGSFFLSFRFGEIAWRNYSQVRCGADGMTKALAIFFFALSIQHFLIGLAFLSILVEEQFITLPRVLIAVAILLLLLSSFNLDKEARNAKDND